MRVPQPRKLGPPDTIPLHSQTAGRNPDIMLIARSKSKSRYVYSAPTEGRLPSLTSGEAAVDRYAVNDG
jgi:hypothetical protein